MKRWDPPVARSEREERLLKLAGKSRKLLVFLRDRRHEIFDAGFQTDLESMYRSTEQGDEPQPPALMSMALLLQGYMQVSDAEAVRLSATDLCWRLVLGTVNERGDKPAFSQGGLQQFRERMIRYDMDRRLLERTIEVAKKSRAFDERKLPKTLRVAVDSRPLVGAGRVEDTINLLGHAGRKIARCMASWLEQRRPFRREARSPQVRVVAFAALSPDLRRLPLVARTSRIRARSSWLAAPSIRFLFVDTQLLLLASFSADLAVGVISPCDSLGVPATKSPRGLSPPGHAHAGHTRVAPGT